MNIDKNITFNFFNYKWARVPRWAKATNVIYRDWYLKRYGYENFEKFKKFLANRIDILDAGCGLGRDIAMFAEANPQASILGIDQSGVAVQEAQRALKGYPNCVVIQGDIITFDLPRKFDFISCDQTLHHTPDPNRTLKNLMNYLKPGGVLNFSVCRLKNQYRDLVDDLIMEYAKKMTPEELWKFAEVVTQFAKSLYDLGIEDISFRGKVYPNIQRFVHDNLFRTWYHPDIAFDLSVSSNYDWFSGNPRFTLHQVKEIILKDIPSAITRIYEDDATISISIEKL